MKAAIFNPYLDTLGGGERYTMAVASTLAKNGYQVDVQWNNNQIKKQLEERFAIDLAGVTFVENIKNGDGYDVCFWVSDGSIPNLKARKNLLHFQVPFRNVNGKTLLNKMKLFRIRKIICNSEFTKKIIDNEYGVESIVLYPPVGVEKFKPKRKENLILYVGRFSALKQAKGQDVLIRAFKNFYKTNKAYKLVLAGGVEIGVGNYLAELKALAKDYPVEFIESPSFKGLQNLYGISKFFWSAAGFGVDENKNPEKVEHFGITLVEAMAAGCIPLVCNAGGYKEIIQNNENGFLWNNTSELISQTKKLSLDKLKQSQLITKAKSFSNKFNYEKFDQEFIKLLV